jgi:hypothetical protein
MLGTSVGGLMIYAPSNTLELEFLQIPDGNPHPLATLTSLTVAKKTKEKEMRAYQVLQILGEFVVILYSETGNLWRKQDDLKLQVVNWRSGNIVHVS